MGEGRETEAPFNMAVATLRRLDIILQQIRNLSVMDGQGSVDKQRAYIELVKQFYINATPLLGDKAKDYEDQILNLSLDTTITVTSGIQKYIEKYSVDKDKELNKILMSIQLKIKRYFMPKGKDPGVAIGDLG